MVACSCLAHEIKIKIVQDRQVCKRTSGNRGRRQLHATMSLQPILSPTRRHKAIVKSALSALMVAGAVMASAFADGRSAPVQFVFTSDAHYGLTRDEFRGYRQVPARVVNEALIAGLFALSLDLILGLAGIVSLGHAAFLGLGAYAAAILASNGFTDPLLGLEPRIDRGRTRRQPLVHRIAP